MKYQVQIVATVLVASCLAFSSGLPLTYAGYPHGYPHGYPGYPHGYPGYPHGYPGYPYAHYPYYYASPTMLHSASLGAPGVSSVGEQVPLLVGDGDAGSDGGDGGDGDSGDVNTDGGMAQGAGYGYGGYGYGGYYRGYGGYAGYGRSYGYRGDMEDTVIKVSQ